ncbi:hypothetical protein F1640_03470 [Novosphingobium sp. NBM11]|uniref:hypothetical protein n=1 Tax=Novosphingobium sp. NBM11 TaxID=2596914 RepID=UPI0018922D94|nr:hypothetical protein [Novosphingobium sp. NBM11]MBF5089107.1 hypothetical protein [Novosphingobium sp. NBM11]
MTTTDRGDGWWDRPSFPFGPVLLQLLTNPGTARVSVDVDAEYRALLPANHSSSPPSLPAPAHDGSTDWSV